MFLERAPRGKAFPWFETARAFRHAFPAGRPAPRLGLQILKAATFMRGHFGTPFESGFGEITAAHRGQPDQRLFHAAAGYTVVEE